MVPPAEDLAAEARPEAIDEEDVIDAFRLAGESCDDCSIAVLGATDPDVEDLLTGRVPSPPRMDFHHPVLAIEWGDYYIAEFQAAANRERDPYVVIVEGSVPNERLADGDGYWIVLAERTGRI